MSYKNKVKKLISKELNVKNVVLFSSCRNAFYFLIKSLNLGFNDEVIIQKFICDSLPIAVKQAGAKSILVEVNKDTFNLDIEKVKSNINENTKAIFFVHTYGNSIGINEIKKLCQEKGILLIEDIAHAYGSSLNGVKAGTFGDYAVYSFTKQMVNFGGGALISNKDVSNVVELRDSMKVGAGLFVYLKRFMASLYETRAFFVSKLLIDFVSGSDDLKLTNVLDKHNHCIGIEAFFAYMQLKNIKKVIEKKKQNYLMLRGKVKTQRMGENSSFNYLSFFFDNKDLRDDAISNSFLFLPVWKNSVISDNLAFVPNSVDFSRKKLKKFVNFFNKYNKKGSLK